MDEREKVSTFDKRLQQALDETGMSKSELAKETGINTAAITSYLAGMYIPKSERLCTLAKALDVAESWLLGYDVAKGPQEHKNGQTEMKRESEAKPMHTNICDMNTGNTYEGFYVLNSMSLKQTGAGKTYLAGEITDGSGSLPVVYWDYAGEVKAEDAGSIVKVRGNVSEYKEKKQFTIAAIRRATKDDGYELKNLVPCAPIDAEAEMQYVLNTIAGFKDRDYRAVAERMLRQSFDQFRVMPAAKGVHHAFVSGLLMHTACMMKTAEGICSVYNGIHGDGFIDRDLLLTGVLVHDLAKTKEFDTSPLGLVKDYTVAGNLLGHAVIGMLDCEAAAKAEGMPEDKMILLLHMIASHHGDPEWGAAAVPMTVEAELLHYIDMIDSRMEIYRETNEKTEKGQFSNRVYALDHKVYNH